MDGLIAFRHPLFGGDLGEPKLLYEVLTQGLGDRVRAVAHAELDLRLFQMSADCLHTKPERLRDFAVQRPHRRQA
jgi:hypothetical protein